MMSALVGFWMTPDSIYLSPAPLYHTAPSVWSMSAQAGGITTVVMEKFDPEGTLDAIQRHRVTHGQFVPAMFVRMLKLPASVRNSYDLSSLKRVMHAAAPCAVHILGEDGAELPANQPGEIYFEGGYSFEYLNDPSKTAASRDTHGWMTVGDIGYLDDEGYLFLTGRRSELIRTGGEFVAPAEVEQTLRDLPSPRW